MSQRACNYMKTKDRGCSFALGERLRWSGISDATENPRRTGPSNSSPHSTELAIAIEYGWPLDGRMTTGLLAILKPRDQPIKASLAGGPRCARVGRTRGEGVRHGQRIGESRDPSSSGV
jgi:hypothetical protein